MRRATNTWMGRIPVTARRSGFRSILWLFLTAATGCALLVVTYLVQRDEVRQRTLLQLVGELGAYYKSHGDYPPSLEAAPFVAVLKEAGLGSDEFDYRSREAVFTLRIRGSERVFRGTSGEVDLTTHSDPANGSAAGF